MSNIKCRSYSASSLPVNLIGPQPYFSKSSGSSGEDDPFARVTVLLLATISASHPLVTAAPTDAAIRSGE
ncbi:MAG TPA: hypothetical protein VGN21_12585 [Stellaceae bacterium]